LNVFVPETFSDGVFEGAGVSALQNLLFREIDRTDGTGERQLIAFAIEKADLGPKFFRVFLCSKKVDPELPKMIETNKLHLLLVKIDTKVVDNSRYLIKRRPLFQKKQIS
jgi:hypothetical protein